MDVRSKATKARIFLQIIAGLCLPLGLLVWLLPVAGVIDVAPIPVRVKLTEIQVVAAIQCFEAEHTRLPGGRPDGLYENPAGNAQLFAALRALDRQQNPHGIVYFEERKARDRRSHFWQAPAWRDGFDPATGALLDFYGRPFKIRLRSELEESAVSPYRDLPADGKSVLVWSLGEDGRQGKAGDPRCYQGSDDIVSWN